MRGIISTILFCFLGVITIAQDLEPRAYANVPKGTNVVSVVYAFSSGDVLTDPSLPIADFKIKANNFGAGYVHTFRLANRLARVQVVAPLIFMSGDLQIKWQGYKRSAQWFWRCTYSFWYKSFWFACT